jgi:hypothetical protein
MTAKRQPRSPVVGEPLPHRGTPHDEMVTVSGPGQESETGSAALHRGNRTDTVKAIANKLAKWKAPA